VVSGGQEREKGAVFDRVRGEEQKRRERREKREERRERREEKRKSTREKRRAKEDSNVPVPATAPFTNLCPSPSVTGHLFLTQSKTLQCIFPSPSLSAGNPEA
jgi:sRNA-binding protein